MAAMAVVVCEMLCYIFSKYGNTDVESIKKTVANFYNSGEITAAKDLIYKCVKDAGVDNDGLPRQVSRRKADNRAAVEVDDIVYLIEALDEKLLLDKLPVFTALKLDRLPSSKSAEMDLYLAVRRIATLEEKLDLVMQQCSELASAVAGSKLRAPDVHNTGFINGHTDLDNGQHNPANQSNLLTKTMLSEPLLLPLMLVPVACPGLAAVPDHLFMKRMVYSPKFRARKVPKCRCSRKWSRWSVVQRR